MHFYCQNCNQRVPSDRKFSLVAGHSVGTLLSFVYPSRAQYSLSWHPGSSCSKQESTQVFKCMFYSMFQVLKCYVFEIYGLATPLVWRSSCRASHASHDLVKPGVISTTGEFRGILSKVTQCEALMRDPFFSMPIPMFGLLFCFKILPKTKSSVKRKSILLLKWCCTNMKKNMYMTCFVCFSLLSVCSFTFVISPERNSWGRHHHLSFQGAWGKSPVPCLSVHCDSGSCGFNVITMTTKEETSQSGGQDALVKIDMNWFQTYLPNDLGEFKLYSKEMGEATQEKVTWMERLVKMSCSNWWDASSFAPYLLTFFQATPAMTKSTRKAGDIAEISPFVWILNMIFHLEGHLDMYIYICFLLHIMFIMSYNVDSVFKKVVPSNKQSWPHHHPSGQTSTRLR